ncbi:codanin-1 isoform X2 [Bacillus rossius redtenbacheri]|uniref:codanin-1 isoform X2 n=2 Tax=Bacillus rossius redtenbacheri TaxID=93214 RepID=UPI002FDD804A
MRLITQRQEPGPASSPAASDLAESPCLRRRDQQQQQRGGRGNRGRQGSQHRPSSISLADFMGGEQRQGRGQRARSKRVTPTKIAGDFATSPTKVETSTNCSPKLSSNIPCSPERVPLAVELNTVQLDPSKVTNSEEITLLCDLYSFLLDNNLVTSIVKELAFCLALLFVRTTKRIFISSADECIREKPSSKVLDSVENCVFFSATMLRRQKAFLSMLDRKTLAVLAENTRLMAFVPDLCAHLLGLGEASSAVWASPYVSSYVMYQDDTDTRAHFQGERTFNAFRRHRDQFYEIYSLWKKSRSQPGWCFSTELGASVGALLASCTNPLNLFHFTRLFRCQLQLSCINCQNYVQNQHLDVDCQFLEAENFQGSVSFLKLDHFSGPEEFFRDFILVATTASAAFIQHLTDSMIHEIVSLNDTAFTANDMGERGTVGEETREHFKLCVAQTMLLGKFLAYMVHLPYYCDEEIAESILEPHIELRKLSTPPIDILKCLTDALGAQKLVVTVPWVVAYLRMLDQVSYRLPYYLTVFDKLFDIYYNWSRLARPCFPPHSLMLVAFSLGSLFEEPGFPSSIYFTWRFGLSSHLKSIPQPMQADGAVDSLDVVDKQAVFLCCPVLWRFHAVLTAASRDPASPLRGAGLGRRAPPPVAACRLEQPSDPGSRGHEVNVKLRNSFFSRQPASTLKTVELVAERVSSSCVKHMETVHATGMRQQAHELFLDVLSAAEVDSMFPAYRPSLLPKLRHIMKQVGQTVSKFMVKNFQHKCLEIAEPFCASRSQIALEALLPDSFNGAIVKACSAEVTKESLKRVKRWIHAHISPEMFEAELKAELERRLRHLNNRVVQGKESGVLLEEGRPVTHLDEAWPPHFAVKSMLRMIQSVIELPPSVELVARAKDLLTMVSHSVQHRQDMIPAVEQLIYAPLSFDLFIHLVVRCHEFVDAKLVQSFVELWRRPELSLGGPLDEVKERLICPRNIHVLGSSLQPEAAWLCFADVLATLQALGFLSAESISAQFLSILQCTWTQEMYHMFNICIQRVISVTTDDKTEYYNLMNLIKTYFEEFEEDDFLGDDLVYD